jgi:hypothetical protein
MDYPCFLSSLPTYYQKNRKSLDERFYYQIKPDKTKTAALTAVWRRCPPETQTSSGCNQKSPMDIGD